jgi:hypothetical protein
MHRAARRTVSFQIGERSLGVAILKAVQTAFLTPLQQFHDSFRGMPGRHVAIELLVEMGEPIDRIAPNDQACNLMGTKLDRRQ